MRTFGVSLLATIFLAPVASLAVVSPATPANGYALKSKAKFNKTLALSPKALAKIANTVKAPEAKAKIAKNQRVRPNKKTLETQYAKLITGKDRKPASTGALIDVTLESKVGVLIDDFPASIRSKVINDYLKKPLEFWHIRAEQQVEATLYRLIYRNLYYSNKGQLPLPPKELWSFEIGTPRFETIDGHEIVTVDYKFNSVLLSSAEQAALADRYLATIGGTVEEAFTLPADPEHLFERTGYSCMDEEDFPPNSVDSENALGFFDHTCRGGKNFCHVTQPYPKDSCDAALKAKVGRISAGVVFTRLPWNEATASSVRVGAANPMGADLEVVAKGLANNRIIYRYFPKSSCAIYEGCVGGSGWRRLLQFDASVANRGSAPAHLGDVGSTSLAAQYNMIEFSQCHAHYHFSHYGKFVYGNGKLRDGSKRAFCLESTSRYSNNEETPLTHPYSCRFQGIEAGWGDDYIAGIECQWIDITAVDTSRRATSDSIAFYSNNDQFICEGAPKLDASGNPIFEPTAFKTETGATVYKMACEFAPNWDSNNTQSINVNVPMSGNTYVTSPCQRGQNTHLRNCGLTYQPALKTCAPGATVKLSCTSTTSATTPQFVRVCEASRALNAGVGCTYRDAIATAVLNTQTTELSFVCPKAKDSIETGGLVSLYTAPVDVADPASTVSCVVKN